MDDVWSYGYTTSVSGTVPVGTLDGKREKDHGGAGGGGGGGGLETLVNTGGAGSSRFKMAGLGFGLPMSRLFARFFGEPQGAGVGREAEGGWVHVKAWAFERILGL